MGEADPLENAREMFGLRVFAVCGLPWLHRDDNCSDPGRVGGGTPRERPKEFCQKMTRTEITREVKT